MPSPVPRPRPTARGSGRPTWSRATSPPSRTSQATCWPSWATRRASRARRRERAEGRRLAPPPRTRAPQARAPGRPRSPVASPPPPPARSQPAAVPGAVRRGNDPLRDDAPAPDARLASRAGDPAGDAFHPGGHSGLQRGPHRARTGRRGDDPDPPWARLPPRAEAAAPRASRRATPDRSRHGPSGLLPALRRRPAEAPLGRQNSRLRPEAPADRAGAPRGPVRSHDPRRARRRAVAGAPELGAFDRGGGEAMAAPHPHDPRGSRGSRALHRDPLRGPCRRPRAGAAAHLRPCRARLRPGDAELPRAQPRAPFRARSAASRRGLQARPDRRVATGGSRAHGGASAHRPRGRVEGLHERRGPRDLRELRGQAPRRAWLRSIAVRRGRRDTVKITDLLEKLAARRRFRLNVLGVTQPDFPVPFICGATRSGTTLMRLMLDAHPDMAIPGETHFLPPMIQASSRRSRSAEELATMVIEAERWGDFHLDEDELRRRFDALDPLNCTDAIRAFYRLYVEKQGKHRWGDKSPGYVRSMILLEKAMPEVRFIHMIRDGRDVALSVVPREWGPKTMAGAADLWRRRIEKARRQAPKLSHYLEVHYEDLITDQEAVLRRVADFIELPWDPVMLDYHERAAERLAEKARDLPTRTGMITAESRLERHKPASDPPRADRIARWKTMMDPADLAEWESIAGDALVAAGYELSSAVDR